MKNLFSYFIILLTAFFPLGHALAQAPQWFVPPRVLDFSGASVTTSTVSSVTGTDASHAAFDDSGNLLFYVFGDEIRDASGNYVSNLFNTPIVYQDELAIIRVPGSCNKFYVIYAMPTPFAFSDLRYSIVDVSGTSVTVATGNANVNFGNGGYEFSTFAIGKLKTNDTRFLYVCGPTIAKRFTISSTGINSATTIISTGVNGGGSLNYWNTELELSPDELKLAWGDRNSNEVNVVTLNSSGAYSSHQTYNVPSTSDIGGLEFSPNSNKIFVSTGNSFSSGTNDGLNVINLTGGTTHVHIGSSSSYSASHIESAVDGLLYVTSTSDLASINPTTNALNTGVLTFTTAPYSNGSRQLPDHVDDEGYFAGAGADLWIMDSSQDQGDEPNNIGSIWEGDVWNCENTQTCLSNEPPEFKNNSDNYMRVRVKNRGCITSQPADLLMYWTRARTGEIWDGHWLDPVHRPANVVNGCAAGGEVTVLSGPGAVSDPITIPALAPGASQIFTKGWRPPDPACFPGGIQLNGYPMVCFLARIESTEDPMANEQYGNIAPNVKNNNNIATRNSYVTNLDPNNIIGGGGGIWVHELMDITHFNLEFIDISVEPGRFTEVGSIRLQLSADLWNDWVGSGMEGEGVEIAGEYEVMVNNASNAVLYNIPYREDAEYTVSPVFEASSSYEFGEEQTYRFMIQHNSDADPYGNSAGVYEVRVSDQCHLNIPSDAVVAEPGSCTTIGTPLSCTNCEVYWEPQEGLSDPYSPVTEACVEENRTYRLTVINNETGCEVSDVVDVFVNDGRRRDEVVVPSTSESVVVSPNPFTDQTTINFTMATEGVVNIRVFDLQGKLWAQPLVNDRRSAGLHSVSMNAAQLARGVYVCEVQMGEVTETVRLVVQ